MKKGDIEELTSFHADLINGSIEDTIQKLKDVQTKYSKFFEKISIESEVVDITKDDDTKKYITKFFIIGTFK